MTTTVQERRVGLHVPRVFTRAGTHPYDEVEWEQRDVVQTSWTTGEVVFEQHGVEFPATWSSNAATIVTTKYFRGVPGTAQREHSLRQLIDRVVHVYRSVGAERGYFATAEDAAAFADELTWMLLHQVFSFNSPVWFNVGTDAPQQVSACFILAVDDSMDSILDWYRDEGRIFKGGSGAGINLSRLRASCEHLSSGGTASGPVSFMRGADASAGTIKSGGATRRAAKMVVLDVDHPDIEEFVEAKSREEGKIRALRAAGYDMELGGRDLVSVQFQNANNSVRVTDAFMAAVEAGGTFDLTARRDGSVVRTVEARALFRRIAQAAWECADPGLQYDGTINDWHTSPASGRITASNPCSEYMHVDNSSCNLASLNLLAFLADDGSIDVERFTAAVTLAVTALDISICFADFPTDEVARTTRAHRQIGIGYANLGALLMATGHAYDSHGGRVLAAAMTSLLTATAYRRSAELARILGAYDAYDASEVNAQAHQRVVAKHVAAHDALPSAGPIDASVRAAASAQWGAALRTGATAGFRNAQVSLLAPTGTIGFMMDCDTTGIEPGFSLVTLKKLVGGGSLSVVIQAVPRALRALGYTADDVRAIVAHVTEHGTVVGAPGLDPAHHAVFDTAVGARAIAPSGHVQMMAAVQPLLSGAISKTVNLPASATVDDVERLYLDGWRLGLKALAVYRDGCKVGQPLTSVASGSGSAGTVDDDAEPTPEGSRPRRPVPQVPRRRAATTTEFSVAGARGSLTVGTFADGTPAEVAVRLGKPGSTLAGLAEAFSAAVSLGLAHGVPLVEYVGRLVDLRFEPDGVTDDPDVRLARSVVDYVVRRLALDYLPEADREGLGIASVTERAAALDSAPRGNPVSPMWGDAPLCLECGTAMRRSGSCHVCETCGTTSGCS